MTHFSKHVEFRYKRIRLVMVARKCMKRESVKIRDSSLYCKGYETQQSH